MTFRSISSWRALALISSLAAGLSGCSDDGLARRYPISGMVTYKGQPVEKGEINFVAVEPGGRSATGQIVKGYYTLTTQEPGDGALPGSYMVTMSAKTPDLTVASDEAKKKGNTAAYIPQGMATAAYKKAPNGVPDKYGTAATSGLKYEVKAQSSKDANFDLAD